MSRNNEYVSWECQILAQHETMRIRRATELHLNWDCLTSRKTGNEDTTTITTTCNEWNKNLL